MGTTFRAIGWFKHVEEDSHKEGCLPHTALQWTGHESFSAPSLGVLLEALQRFCGGTKDDTELDACGEYGRVDIAVYENKDGYAASAQERDAWAEGNGRLWYATYTFRVEACSPVMFNRPRTTDVRAQTKDWTPEQLAIGRPFNDRDENNLPPAR